MPHGSAVDLFYPADKNGKGNDFSSSAKVTLSARYKRSADPMFLYNASNGGWINPAKFIYENILYPNCRLYVVKNKMLGKDKLPMSNTSILRNLLPPGVIFSILFESNEAETEFGLDLNTSGVCGYAYPKKNIAVDMSIGGATIKVC